MEQVTNQGFTALLTSLSPDPLSRGKQCNYIARYEWREVLKVFDLGLEKGYFSGLQCEIPYSMLSSSPKKWLHGDVLKRLWMPSSLELLNG